MLEANKRKATLFMRVKIEIEEGLEEAEVIVRCGQLDESVLELQNYIASLSGKEKSILLTRGETEYYIPVLDIYFFETEGKQIHAHTAGEIFDAPYRLYELEEQLPGCFMRISKSTIANLEYIYSITRNLTASSLVEFKGSNKKALVSRGYYKALTERLKSRKVKK